MTIDDILNLSPLQLKTLSNNLFRIYSMENGTTSSDKIIDEPNKPNTNSYNKEEVINSAKHKILEEALKKAKVSGKTLNSIELYKLLKG